MRPASDVQAYRERQEAMRAAARGRLAAHRATAAGRVTAKRPASGGGLCGCGVRLRVVPAKRGDAGGCERPVWLVCPECGAKRSKRCRTLDAGKCAPCAHVKRGDLARIGRSGVREGSASFMVTLTAPGGDVLPWDRSVCTHAEGVRCSGARGCRVDADAAAVWHGMLGRRWSWLITYLRRRLGVDVQYMRTYEAQRRGALHVHALVRVDGACTVERLQAVLAEVGSRWAFGEQIDVQALRTDDPGQCARAAGYVAKYVTKAAGAVGSVRMIDADGVVRVGRLRCWSATRRYGDTCRMIDAERAAWAAATAGVVPRNEAHPPGTVPLDLNGNRSTVAGVGERPIDASSGSAAM